ncbi:MAG: phosphate/phosphite/phosphonate ABC transporter substrate-binding protein [Corynebacterium sp.]|uniref:phosphate/phosphite/phosphonate ABC transporter substrate-binding protein n=1 Tax=Corynebacterium sp. TaxID=1720 RepID=UPI003F97C80E
MRLKTRSALAILSVLTLTLAGCAGDEGDVTGGGDDTAAASDADITSVDELVISLIPSTDSDQIVEDADAVADQLSDALGGFPVTIDVAHDYLGSVTALRTGDAHIVFTGPIGMIQAEEQADAVPTLQALRDGSENYVTQWFTNDPDKYCDDEPVANDDGFLFCNGILDEDSGELAEYGPMGEDALQRIEEGTTVSYVSQGSASGYYYPATQLDDLNGFTPGSGDIDEQFSGDSHDNSVLNVYNGNAEVGTSFDDARENVVEEAEDVGEEVVVFAWAGPIPNDGIVMAGDDVLTEEERETINEAFLSFSSEGDLDEGDALYDVYEINGLAPADEEALAGARDVYNNFPEAE